MSVKKLADSTADKIIAATGAMDTDAADIANLIENALLEAVRTSRSEAVDVVNHCCSADQDLAHKIREQLRDKEKAIIANLMNLR